MKPSSSSESPAPQGDIHKGNLFLKIWTQPTATYQYIFQNQPEKYIHILLILGGITQTLNRASSKGLGDDISLLGVIATSIIVGGLVGWAVYLIAAWALSFLGSFIKGKATPNQFQVVIGWALVPYITTLVLMIAQILLFGEQTFKSEFTQISEFQLYASVFLFGIGIILTIWTIVLMIKGIAIIQDFSVGRATVNFFMPLIALVVIGALLFVIVDLFFAS